MKQIANDCYDGPTLSVTINREGARVHRLIDDTIYPTRAKKMNIRRDPMVEALFGAAAEHPPRATPARKIKAARR
ncbi:MULTISPECIES: hypothetical protein [unclassified Duganella]|jgi:hypothetical protein|uniref:hypothetical protein n=1 Tax=unclassified Duganella TaxID=2636909 RepID=UPI000886241A|nr:MULTISPECIES: hypothetical protein [unclassified Duganella]SDG41915.1 hypothetical protein SAMN05216320_104266 [Duganella sp. OV458]SDJ62150.1 hypothetical protein SAMN05428973_105138 [Duganella sp. OV510]